MCRDAFGSGTLTKATHVEWPLGVVNCPSELTGLRKFSSNFMGLVVSFFAGYVRMCLSRFLPKVVPQSLFWKNLERLAVMTSERVNNHGRFMSQFHK